MIRVTRQIKCLIAQVLGVMPQPLPEVNFLMVEIPTPKPYMYIFMIRVTRQMKWLIAHSLGVIPHPLLEVNFLMVEIPTPKPYTFMIRVTRQIKCPGGVIPHTIPEVNFLAHLAFRPCELLSSLFVRRRPSTFHILIFSPETTGPIATKLWWNGPWMASFQNYVRWSRLPTKMAAKLKIEKRGDEILIVHCCFSVSQNELKF